MVDVSGAASIETAARAYQSADTRVIGAGPDHIMRTDETPNAGEVPIARCLHACFTAPDGRFVICGAGVVGKLVVRIDPSNGL